MTTDFIPLDLTPADTFHMQYFRKGFLTRHVTANHNHVAAS